MKALSRLSPSPPSGPSPCCSVRSSEGLFQQVPPRSLSPLPVLCLVSAQVCLCPGLLPLPPQTAGSRGGRHLFCSLRATQHPLPLLTQDRDGGKRSNVSIRTPDSTRLLTGALKWLLLSAGPQAGLRTVRRPARWLGEEGLGTAHPVVSGRPLAQWFDRGAGARGV